MHANVPAEPCMACRQTCDPTCARHDDKDMSGPGLSGPGLSRRHDSQAAPRARSQHGAGDDEAIRGGWSRTAAARTQCGHAFNHVQNKTLLIAQEPRKFCSAESNWETKRAAGPPTHLQVHVALENALRTKQFMDKSHRSPDTCKAPIAHILCTGLADSPSRLRPGSGAGSLRPRNLQGIARGSATLK